MAAKLSFAISSLIVVFILPLLCGASNSFESSAAEAPSPSSYFPLPPGLQHFDMHYFESCSKDLGYFFKHEPKLLDDFADALAGQADVDMVGDELCRTIVKIGRRCFQEYVKLAARSFWYIAAPKDKMHQVFTVWTQGYMIWLDCSSRSGLAAPAPAPSSSFSSNYS